MSGATLVFDVGSSSLKATLFGAAGEVVGQARADYPAPSEPHRQSPEDWWRAAVAACGQLAPQRVDAIALAGTMENLIAVGADLVALGDAVLYSDPCGACYLDEQQPALVAAGASAIAGNAPEPLMTAFKLAWLRQHQPERFADALLFLPGAKDYLALRLTGQAVTDPTCAATTGLMDIAARDWSSTLLDLHGVARDRLPRILPATAVVGPLAVAAAAALGLAAGIPVVNGCGDGGATTLGGGAEGEGDTSIYLGTSGWVARVAALGDRAAPHPFYRLPHPLHDGVIEIAPILSGGAATQWARSLLGLDLERAEVLAREADAEPGEALFLPYLNGERSPFLDLALRAGFVNVAASDGPGSLYYAVLEGVAFAIAANLEAMGGAGTGSITLVGGGATSRVWTSIIADVLDHQIEVPADPVSVTGRGAFHIGAKALGRPHCAQLPGTVLLPRPDRRQRIARQSAQFSAATGLLRRLRQDGGAAASPPVAEAQD